MDQDTASDWSCLMDLPGLGAAIKPKHLVKEKWDYGRKKGGVKQRKRKHKTE